MRVIRIDHAVLHGSGVEHGEPVVGANPDPQLSEQVLDPEGVGRDLADPAGVEQLHLLAGAHVEREALERDGTRAVRGQHGTGAAQPDLVERLGDRGGGDPHGALRSVDRQQHLAAPPQDDGAAVLDPGAERGSQQVVAADREVCRCEDVAHAACVTADLLLVAVHRDGDRLRGRVVGGVPAGDGEQAEAEGSGPDGQAGDEGADAHRTPNLELPGHGRAVQTKSRRCLLADRLLLHHRGLPRPRRCLRNVTGTCTTRQTPACGNRDERRRTTPL
jgi:hypothetical protein